MIRTKLDDAVEDLRPGEFVFWLQLHELYVPYRPYVGTLAHLARKIAGRRTRPAILQYCRALAAKEYISFEETHKGEKKISLERRLDTSAGAYCRF